MCSPITQYNHSYNDQGWYGVINKAREEAVVLRAYDVKTPALFRLFADKTEQQRGEKKEKLGRAACSA